jgi:branched-chain amino acid transport system permease protein
VLAAFQALTIYGSQYALVVMGLLLVATVLVAPKGLIVTFAKFIGRMKFVGRMRHNAKESG